MFDSIQGGFIGFRYGKVVYLKNLRALQGQGARKPASIEAFEG